VFNLTTFTYTLGTNSLLIFKDGAVLDPPNPNPVDFTETSTSQFQLATPCTGGETIIAFGFVGITGTMPSIISDLMVANYQAIREYTDTAEILYAKGAVTSVDGGESYFQLTTGAAPGTYVDDNATVLVPTGGDGSSAWIRTKGIPVPIPGVAPAHKKGLIYYDAITNTFTGFNDISDVALNFGEEMWARVKNNTGSDITNGQALYINGVSSGLPTVELAQADDRTTAEMVGIATHNIPDGTEGIITTFGLVRGVNTFGLTGGQMIWLSPAVAGAVTTTKPTTDNYIVEIGNVMNVDAVNGTFFVRVTHPIDYTDINKTGRDELPGALIYEEVISGAPVTSFTPITGLDINIHRSYRVEMELKNVAGVNANIEMFINNDLISANYTRVLSTNSGTNETYLGANDALVSGVLGSNEYANLTANLRCGTGGEVSFISEIARDFGGTLLQQTSTVSKNSTVTNITQLDIVSTQANSIGIGSTVRIYRG
jgi:hypothetical protein